MPKEKKPAYTVETSKRFDFYKVACARSLTRSVVAQTGKAARLTLHNPKFSPADRSTTLSRHEGVNRLVGPELDLSIHNLRGAAKSCTATTDAGKVDQHPMHLKDTGPRRKPTLAHRDDSSSQGTSYKEIIAKSSRKLFRY